MSWLTRHKDGQHFFSGQRAHPNPIFKGGGKVVRDIGRYSPTYTYTVEGQEYGPIDRETRSKFVEYLQNVHNAEVSDEIKGEMENDLIAAGVPPEVLDAIANQDARVSFKGATINLPKPRVPIHRVRKVVAIDEGEVEPVVPGPMYPETESYDVPPTTVPERFVKYPAASRPASYQRYLDKLRRRRHWQRRVTTGSALVKTSSPVKTSGPFARKRSSAALIPQSSPIGYPSEEYT